MKPIYLDYAATTPTDPRVVEAMAPYFTENFGNPGSLHSYGQKTSAAIFKARQAVAQAIGAHYTEIIFTGSATEANNLAIRGAVQYFQKKFPNVKPRILIPEIEHDCVLETAKGATELGVEVVYIPVSKGGIVDVAAIKKNLNGRTVLVSVMYANNEIGTIQPIAKIAAVIRDFRKSLKLQANSSQFEKVYPLFQTDAVQAFEYLSCNVNELGVDMLTLSGHKIYGPKGIGALYVKNRALGSRKLLKNSMDKYLLKPLVMGGGQEEGMRSGTENVPAIVGFAKAVELAMRTRDKEKKRLATLSHELWRGIQKVWPTAQLNGDKKNRLPNHLNVYLPGQKAERVLTALDLMGITISSGSACSARTPEPSKVLLAMGMNKERAQNSLRITLGRPTTAADLAATLKAFQKLKVMAG